MWVDDTYVDMLIEIDDFENDGNQCHSTFFTKAMSVPLVHSVA